MIGCQRKFMKFTKDTSGIVELSEGPETCLVCLPVVAARGSRPACRLLAKVSSRFSHRPTHETAQPSAFKTGTTMRLKVRMLRLCGEVSEQEFGFEEPRSDSQDLAARSHDCQRSINVTSAGKLEVS
jgi:hypothetical protein